jgi:RNA recognition motif. (a.k.a. RRM, RBD, or RNP domain)
MMTKEAISGARRSSSSSQPPADDSTRNDHGGGAHQSQQSQQQRQQHHYKDSLKIFVSRIPVHFDENAIRRLVTERLLAQQEEEEGGKNDSKKDDGDENRHSSNDDDNGRGGGEDGVVLAVELAYPKTTNEEDKVTSSDHDDKTTNKYVVVVEPQQQPQQQQHKGYGFVVLKDTTLVQRALALGKLRRCGAKPTSSRQNYTLYIGPCLTDAEKEKQLQAAAAATATSAASGGGSNKKQPCFLWTSSGNKHCPYGPACKFLHVGGGRGRDGSGSTEAAADVAAKKKKKVKCRDHRKDKCKLGADACPFSHDFEPKTKKYQPPPQKDKNANDSDNDDEQPATMNVKRDDSEKDCISWKTKGKCRNFQKTDGNGIVASSNSPTVSSSSSSSRCCPYRHDPDVQKAALDKIARKKRSQNDHEEPSEDIGDVKATNCSNKRQRRGDDNKNNKVKQPLCIRVFGMSYDTTRDDVQRAFTACGKITQIDFPVFDDASRRSKGYCSVTFCTHKAVEKAVAEMDGHLEKERWWRVQAGNMLLDQWES